MAQVRLPERGVRRGQVERLRSINRLASRLTDDHPVTGLVVVEPPQPASGPRRWRWSDPAFGPAE